MVKWRFQLEVLKEYDDPATRGRLEGEITVLVVLVAVGVAFCGNVLFGVGHSQNNITGGNVW